MIAVERVTVYPVCGGLRDLSLAEALSMAESAAAEPLILGAMRPGHLGREMVTTADLREATKRRHRGIAIVPAASAPEWLGSHAAPGWVAWCPCGERIWGSYQSDVKASINDYHRDHASAQRVDVARLAS